MPLMHTPQNILITGGAGFIGSHVAAILTHKYPHYKIVVLDKLDYCATLDNLEGCIGRPNFKFVKGDITSADLIRHILQSEAIDTIVHFAAQSHCDHLFGNSLSFTLNDTYGTHVLLESSRVYGAIGRFVNVSTDAVFGEATWETSTPLNDKTVLKPTNPYSASKAAVEMMVKAFVNSYHLPCITVRANNVYGPRQYPEKLIPKMILLATRQKDLPIHGTGENMHRYVYVEDVAEAFDLVIHKGIAGDTYNIGTAHEQSVKKIVEAIAARVGLGSNKITYVKERAFISDRHYMLCGKTLEGIGWTQSTSWDDGLKKTIEWYMATDVVRHFSNGDILSALEPHPTVAKFFPKGGRN